MKLGRERGWALQRVDEGEEEDGEKEKEEVDDDDDDGNYDNEAECKREELQ